MEFSKLLDLVGDEPVFETGLLLAGDVNPNMVRIQLNRWTKSGKLYQLRRGLYALAPPYQKVKPHPFLIANRLQKGSYVSCQSALSFYGLIPEVVFTTVSVTTGRSNQRETMMGRFSFLHIKQANFRGYHMVNLGGQQALVATPEKALLDLVSLQEKGEPSEFLQSDVSLQKRGNNSLGCAFKIWIRLIYPSFINRQKIFPYLKCNLP